MIFIFSHAWAQDAPEADDEAVVVTGTRTERPLGESPVAVEVLTAEDIARTGSVDVSDALESQPGVEIVRDYLGATIRLRGMDPDQVLVLVDGQRLVGQTGGAADLSRIPVEEIERIEVVKGPASALYGADAVGGVVQIFTRSARRPSLSANARGGTIGNLDGSVSGSTGRRGIWGARLTGGWHHAPAIDRTPDTVATSLDSKRIADVGGRVDAAPNPDLTVPVTFSYSGTVTSGISSSPAGAVIDRTNATEDARVMLQPSLTGERSRTGAHLGVSAFRDQYRSDQREGDEDALELTTERLLQGGLQRDQVAGPHVVSFGAEGAWEHLVSDRIGPGSADRQWGAVYAQDEWKVVDHLVAVPSARVDADSWYGVVPTPRLALRADPTSTLTLRGTAGTSYRAPRFRELLLRFDNPGVGYRVEGNPDLRPEHTFTVDAAVEWVPSTVASVAASGWWSPTRDLIDLGGAQLGTDGATVYQYVNVREALIRGFEVGGTLDPTERLGFTAGYTFTDARDRATGERLLGRAAHRITGRA
ncbi:MAG: TonB-dependent receptor, partial [Myxococcota bacterium]